MPEPKQTEFNNDRAVDPATQAALDAAAAPQDPDISMEPPPKGKMSANLAKARAEGRGIPWSKKKAQKALEEKVDGWVDPEPGNWNPEGAAIGVEENNRQAEIVEKRDKEFEQTFFPKPPEHRPPRSLKMLPFHKKVARYLQSYNARGGNETFAMLESGLTRPEIRKLKETDEPFRAALEEIALQIKDRAKYIVMQRIGLVKAPAVMAKVADNMLMTAAKALDKDLFGDQGGGTVNIILNVPRPIRGENGAGVVLPDGKASGSPLLPG